MTARKKAEGKPAQQQTKQIGCEVPVYVYEALRSRQFSENKTLRTMFLEAFSAIGIEVCPNDLGDLRRPAKDDPK